MALIDKTVKVPEALNDFGEALVKVINTIDEQLEDGWQPTQDIPPILGSLVADLSSKLSAVKAVQEEVTAYPVAAGRSIGITVSEAIEAILE